VYVSNVGAPPPSEIGRIPSHAEAIRMLQRAELFQPDRFGHWNGTDYAQRRATKTLWWAYVGLLVKVGEIDRAVLDPGSEALSHLSENAEIRTDE